LALIALALFLCEPSATFCNSDLVRGGKEQKLELEGKMPPLSCPWSWHFFYYQKAILVIFYNLAKLRESAFSYISRYPETPAKS
jgi:hypothetical protein